MPCHVYKVFEIVLVDSTFILYAQLFIIMERDVNIKLIYIILILLLALVGTTVFYQTRYDNLKENYEQTFREYNRTYANISAAQKSLYSNISDLNVSIDRENALIQKLEQKSKELETVSTELAVAQQQLFESRQNLDTMSVNSSYANEILNRHKAIIGKMQAKLDTLRIDVETNKSQDIVLDDITALETELDNLKSN